MKRDIKILIVDNEPDSLEVINNIIVSSGENYEILLAITGKNALHIIKKEKPDLIISDWVMPEMSGIDLIGEIQSLNLTNPLPVIICTGAKLEVGYLAKALNKGAVDFIHKPIEPIELISRVKSILRFSDTYKLLMQEREKNAVLDKGYLENIIKQQDEELKSKAISISRFNQLLSSVNSDLKNLAKNVHDKASEINISEVVIKIDKNIKSDNWKDFKVSFEKHYPDFFNCLLQINNELTNSELRLAALLKINSSTKAISGITQQSVRSLEMARFRLRKKLNIPKDESFEVFFNKLNC